MLGASSTGAMQPARGGPSGVWSQMTTYILPVPRSALIPHLSIWLMMLLRSSPVALWTSEKRQHLQGNKQERQSSC